MKRARLTDRLLLSPPARLVLLCAPAGYSKSTTLRHWADADRRPFSWIACDQRHDDPAHLVGEIADALAVVRPMDEETKGALQLEAAWPDRALARLGNAMAGETHEFVLVIDDAHRLRSEDSMALLAGLSGVLPAEAQLAIASRSAPPVQLGRMRANRELVELGATDLAMTRRESGRLLHDAGLDPDEHQLDSIHERTEGWPAALQLASLALNGAEDSGEAIEAFAGDDRAVAEYLRDEFLSVSDPELVEFMTRTSLLKTLSGPACDAILGRTGSADVLRGLARSNALVIPLDRKDEEFRYHHLLTDMLRSELFRSEPSRVTGLHTNASRWYRENSETEPAVEHAIASNDICLAGCLIWEAVPDLTGRGRVATLNRWLDDVGPDHFRECHGLLFTAAHTSMLSGSGERAEYWLGLAERTRPQADCPVQVDIDLPMLRATHPKNGIGAMGSDAEYVMAHVDPESPWRGAAGLYLGVSKHLLGDPGDAIPVLEEAVRASASKSPVIQSLALAQLAVIALEDEDLDGASRLVSAARGQVDRCGLAEYPAMTLVYAADSMVLAARGQSVRAAESLTAGLRLLEMLESFPPWYEAEARIAFGRAGLKLGLRDVTSEMLKEAAAHLDPTAGGSVLAESLDLLRKDHDSAPENDSVATPLTRAEMRTLGYLPTHLSFRQIGEANRVSQNTVKTQARSIYRKLGVGSRAEAVDAARETGLLDAADPNW